MRLAETIGRWLGRVEVALVGGEGLLRVGEEALSAGDPAAAREAAHALLARVPGSPIGLALLADACEMGGLTAEGEMALEELSQRAPSRADVWIRLGRARARVHGPHDGGPTEDAREAFARALAVAEPGSDERREALLALADWDLSHGAPDRAQIWLERIVDPAGAAAPDVALRRAEALLGRGHAAAAGEALEKLSFDPTDGRGNLALGRVRALRGDPGAILPLLRATIVDAAGASDALSSALARLPTDDATRARVRAVVEARGEAGLARWRAAFARAEGRRSEARAALMEAVRAGEAGAARPLLDTAMQDRDPGALAVAVGALGGDDDPLARDARTLAAVTALDPTSDPPSSVLAPLATLTTAQAAAWAAALRAKVAEGWVPPAGSARWDALLGRLEAIARALHDLDASAALASLAAERRRPLRVAVVGEFNAGKSTFINALMGEEIAPMGILPTTATLHHLRYAHDPIARVVFQPDGPPERILPVGELRGVLAQLDPGTVRRVEIFLPIVPLTRAEILDTPGFNAPDARHTDAARAAFDEADAAIWLLDATQAMKKTERDVLERARAARLPVQVLVNKIDRIAEGDRARVLGAVEDGLRESGIASWSPPLAFSARLALEGRLGEARALDGASERSAARSALEASGWAEVDAMLERELFARSEELKERALRRRALGLVGTLGQTAVREADVERSRSATRSARIEAVAHAAARIDRDAETIAARIAEGLGRASAAWQAEMELVVSGRGTDAIEADASLGRYRVDRALAHLTRPLAHALAGAAEATGVTPVELTPAARTAIRAFAWTSREPRELLPLVRSAVASLVEHLSTIAATPAPPQAAAGLVGELSAYARALGGEAGALDGHAVE